MAEPHFSIHPITEQTNGDAQSPSNPRPLYANKRFIFPLVIACLVFPAAFFLVPEVGKYISPTSHVALPEHSPRIPASVCKNRSSLVAKATGALFSNAVAKVAVPIVLLFLALAVTFLAVFVTNQMRQPGEDVPEDMEVRSAELKQVSSAPVYSYIFGALAVIAAVVVATLFYCYCCKKDILSVTGKKVDRNANKDNLSDIGEKVNENAKKNPPDSANNAANAKDPDLSYHFESSRTFSTMNLIMQEIPDDVTNFPLLIDMSQLKPFFLNTEGNFFNCPIETAGSPSLNILNSILSESRDASSVNLWNSVNSRDTDANINQLVIRIFAKKAFKFLERIRKVVSELRRTTIPAGGNFPLLVNQSDKAININPDYFVEAIFKIDPKFIFIQGNEVDFWFPYLASQVCDSVDCYVPASVMPLNCGSSMDPMNLLIVTWNAIDFYKLCLKFVKHTVLPTQ